MNGQESNHGLVQLTSKHSFETTYEMIKTALEANPKIGILAEVDHSGNAAGVDLELPKTHLILFGNPNLGTPLMQSSRTVALDLPQKILIWEDTNGKVHLVYNDPKYLITRHGIRDKDAVADKISGALASITKKILE